MLGIQEASMRSIRPYKTSEEYLEAMKEDLAEWLKDLYGLDIDAGSFLEVLETGVLLCHHANSITQFAGELSQEYPRLREKVLLPTRTVACNNGAQPGTFQARDNVSNFIQWCRKEMGIKEVLMFETEDLVLHKNEKNFVLCLLEVARSASRFGVSAPTLIQMEEEIEEEIRKEMDLPPEDTPLPKPPREPPNFKNLDQMVQHLVSRCTCPVQFPMIKVSEGKYRVGDSSILIFVRILRSHVMVRVGGGWDTLEHYLDKHDPCRCSSLSHKQVLSLPSSQRSQAVQVQHEITARLMPEMNSPHKPQVTLMVSRSQSPLPPVEWRTYAARGRRLQSSPVPSHGEAKSARVKERPATPFFRAVPTERSPESKQTGSSWSGRETNRVTPSIQKNGPTETNPPFLKPLLDPQQRRSMERIQVVTPLNKRIERPNVSSTASWRNRASQPLKSVQEMRCSPNPMKYLAPSSQQNTKTPLRSSQESKDGEIMASRQEDPAVRRSPSPKKHIFTVQKGHSKTPDKTGLSFGRPPTPCRSYQDVPDCENGGYTLSKVQGPLPSKEVPKNKVDPQREVGKVFTVDSSRSRTSRNAGFRTHTLDLGQKMKGYQELLKQEDTTGKPFGYSHGITKFPIQGNKYLYTHLPMDLAKEQALYKSLEDEILSNIKELEEISEENLAKESLLAGMRMDDSLREDNNTPRLSSPSWTSLQSPKRALISDSDVPRSGVYVPEGETRWHLIGEHYNRVIHELSMTLHEAHLRTEGMSPLSCSPLGSKQLHKDTCLGGEPPLNEKNLAPRKEENKPCLETHEEHVDMNGSGDSPQAMQSKASHSSGSSLPLEASKDLQAKPKRSLKKPERVPSIYKLKLRPKICPRRDNRPDRRPSRIPAPVAYRSAQRSAKAKGQLKASSRSTKRQNQDNTTRLGPNSPPSTQRGESQTEVEIGISASEESWV